MGIFDIGRKPQTSARDFGAFVSRRLLQEKDALAIAACRELGFPIRFIYDQLDYAAQCLDALAVRAVNGEGLEAAFLFPTNTEGAMPAYILALAVGMGTRVHAKLSRRCPGIQVCLERVFADVDKVHFHRGSGQEFLNAMLEGPKVHFIQVFGDDAWISDYEDQVRASGKTLAFDGPGKDPVIVLQGANLENAVEGSIASGLFAGGAACMSAERFLVHVDLLEPFLETLAQRLSKIKPMAPDRPDAVLGYLYSRQAAVRQKEQIAEAIQSRAKIVLEGQIEPIEFDGCQFHACSPFILRDVPTGSRVLTEETFGPIFPVLSFRTTEEAIAMAEDCPYGLTATVFGPQEEAMAVALQLQSSHAIVYVNETMLEAFCPEHWGSGGFKRSGWVWETAPDGTFLMRTGYRPLRQELEKAIKGVHRFSKVSLEKEAQP